MYSLHLNRLVAYPMFRTVLRWAVLLNRHYLRPAAGSMAPDLVAATHWLVAESGSFHLTQVVVHLMFRTEARLVVWNRCCFRPATHLIRRTARGLSAVSRSKPDRAYSVLSQAAGSMSSTAGYCRSSTVLATQQIHLNQQILATRLVAVNPFPNWFRSRRWVLSPSQVTTEYLTLLGLSMRSRVSSQEMAYRLKIHPARNRNLAELKHVTSGY